MKLLFATAALGILLFCPDIVMACSCGGTPSVCVAYATAEAVFVGTVVRVENDTRDGTDAEGRFKLTVLEGLKGTLLARLYTIPLDTPNCPEINKLAQAHKDIETNRVKLEVNRDHQDIELTFTIPYCAKKQEKRE